MQNGTVFSVCPSNNLQLFRNPKIQSFSVYLFPLAKYSQLYSPFVLSIPAESSIAELRRAVFEVLSRDTTPKKSREGDYTYTKVFPRDSKDIRLFRFARYTEPKERKDWEKSVDKKVKGRVRQEWILEQVSNQCGNGCIFDHQCGNEIDDSDSFSMMENRPKYIETRNDELFCYFSVMENRDVNKDVLFVSVIDDDEYQEITIQTDGDFSYEFIENQVSSYCHWSSESIIGYCVEEGRITEEHNQMDSCLYAMKYQLNSQFCMTKNELSNETSIKCYCYLIEGWNEDRVPILSLSHIPRIFFISPKASYKSMFDHLCCVYGVNREDLIGYYFLDPYTRLLEEESCWTRIANTDVSIEENPVDDSLLEGWDEDWVHPPVFAMYINVQREYSFSLHVYCVWLY